MKNYKCPCCGKEQTSIRQSVDAIVVYEIDLESESYEEKDIQCGDVISWACPKCGKTIPNEFAEKLNLD